MICEAARHTPAWSRKKAGAVRVLEDPGAYHHLRGHVSTEFETFIFAPKNRFRAGRPVL